MVSNVNEALFGANKFAGKVNGNFQPTFQPKPEQYQEQTFTPNYAQYDCYKSPVTTGVSGDRFDMMM